MDFSLVEEVLLTDASNSGTLYTEKKLDAWKPARKSAIYYSVPILMNLLALMAIVITL